MIQRIDIKKVYSYFVPLLWAERKAKCGMSIGHFSQRVRLPDCAHVEILEHKLPPCSTDRQPTTENMVQKQQQHLGEGWKCRVSGLFPDPDTPPTRVIATILTKGEEMDKWGFKFPEIFSSKPFSPPSWLWVPNYCAREKPAFLLYPQKTAIFQFLSTESRQVR